MLKVKFSFVIFEFLRSIKKLLFLTQILIPSAVNAQVLYSENFNGAINWNLNEDGNALVSASPPANGANNNVWVRNNSGPATIDGSANLHISCTGGLCDNGAGQPSGTKFNGTSVANNTNRIALMNFNFPASAFAGTNLLLEFQWVCNNAFPTSSPGMRMVYSVNDGATWTDFNQTFSGASTTQVASVPVNAASFAGFNTANPKLRIGFRWFNEPNLAPKPAIDNGFVLDNLVIRNAILASGLSLDPGTSSQVCRGDNILVKYTATGFPGTNTFTLQLSDPTGNFGAPTNLGVLSASPASVLVPSNITPGAGYRLRIRASDGTISNTSLLNIKKFPNPFVTGIPSICSGNPTLLTANPIANVGSYQWNLNSNPIAGAVNNTFNATLAGSYSVTVDSLGCVRTSVNLNVTNQASPNAVILGPPNFVICMNGSIPVPPVIKANKGANLAHQWFRNGIPINPNGSADSLVVTQGGSYTVRVTNTLSGCTTLSAPAIGTEVQRPPVPSAGLDSAVCSDDTVTAGFQPGVAFNGLTFNWIPTTGVLDFFVQNPSPNSPFVKITRINNGTIPDTTFYKLFAIDPATGCIASDEVRIITNPNPTILSVGPNVSVCENGNQVALVGVPGSSTNPLETPQRTGFWTGTGIATVPVNQTVFIPNPGLLGPNALRYILLYDWKNGGKVCSNFQEKTITVNQAPVVQAGDPNSFCKNILSVVLDGFSPTFPTATWSGPSMQPNGTFFPSALPVGAYVCTLSSTNANGCTSTATRTITVTAPPVVDAGQPNQFLCSNIRNYQMTGFSPATSPDSRWSSRNIPIPITITTGGALTFDSAQSGTHRLYYQVTKDGCTVRDSVSMTIITAPKVRILKNDSICANDSAKFISGATPVGGTWRGLGVDPSGTKFLPSQSPLGPQLLVYRISQNGCKDSANMIMVVKQAPIVDAGKNDTICAGLDSLRMAGFTPAGGRWTGLGIDSAGTFRPKKFGLIGNILLTYRVRQNNGCSASDQKQITIKQLPVAIAGEDTAMCTGSRIRIGAAALPNLIYKWQEPTLGSIPGDTLSEPLLGITIPGNQPDTFNVFLKVTDTLSKCSSQDTMRVIVYPRPKAQIQFPGIKAKCFGDSFILRAVVRPGLEYQWLRNNLSLNVFSPTDSILTIGLSGKYQLVVRNIGATCTDTSAYNVSDSLSIFPRFIPRIIGTKRFCKDSTTQVSVSPQNEGYSYEWQYNGVIVPDSIATTFTIGKRGTLRVILRTDRGCRDSSSIVTIDSLPIPFTGNMNDTTICENDIATFRAPFDSLFSYRWMDSSTGAVLSVKDTLRTVKPGKYYVEVYNACKVALDSVQVLRVYPLPRFGILNSGRRDTAICVDDPYNDLVVRLFGPTGYRSYSWSADSGFYTGNGRQFILPNQQLGEYDLGLGIRDEFGCFNSDTIRVRVVDCPPVVYIPNAFSPNGDGTNDFWRLSGYDIDAIKIYVYNRWGQQVYYSEKLYDNIGWDGSFNGVVCPSGTYKFLVEYIGESEGELITKRETGTVTVLR